MLLFLYLATAAAYQCSSGSYFSGALPCTSCPTGSACTGDDTRVPCPVGRFQGLPGSTECTACAAGTYGTGTPGATSAASCAACGPGRYSAAGSSACLPCSAGTTCAAGSCAACASCPAGSSSPALAVACTPCAKGTFANSSGSACVPCPAGRAAPAAGSGYCPLACSGWPASFSPAGADSCCAPGRNALEGCAFCPAGTYAQVLSNASATMTNCTACAAGSASGAVAATLASTCAPCQAGRYSSARGAASCAACAVGSYSNAVGANASAACAPCPPNSAGGGGTLASCAACPRDTFSAAGWGACCSRGYAVYAGSSTCFACPAGTWGGGGTQCFNCPAGTYQPATAQTSALACLACPAGSFSSVVGYAGYVTTDFFPAVYSCERFCPAGSWSASNASACTPCAAGRYSEAIAGAATSEGVCAACPAGRLSSPGAAGCCTARQALFSERAAGRCTYSQSVNPAPPTVVATDSGCSTCYSIRPRHAYSSSGYSGACTLNVNSLCAGCPDGGYSGLSVNVSGCLSCPPGATSTTSQPSTIAAESIRSCTNCSAGTYSSGGLCFPCPSGSDTRGRTGTPSVEKCEPCPVGFTDSFVFYVYRCNPPYGEDYVLQKNGAGSCQQCPAGTAFAGGLTLSFSPPSGFTQPISTPSAGSQLNYLLTNAYAPCLVCPAGRASAPGSGVCCPFGQVAVGSLTCQSCPIGTYAAISTVTVAPATPHTIPSSTCSYGGSRSVSISASTASGSSVCLTCPQGTTSLLGSANLQSCTPCRIGQHGTPAGLCSPCPPNTFVRTTGSPNASSCEACGAGLFSASGAGVCCAPGQWAPPGSLACTACSAGRYCPPGATAELPCPRGTWGNATGMSALSSCQQCSPGSYMDSEGSTSAACTACPTGRFVGSAGATAASACLLCPAGTYGAAAGLGQCTGCAAGRYNPSAGSMDAQVCMLCAEGTFSTGGAASCTPCPQGTYGSALGANASSLCQQCPPGTSNNKVGSTTQLDCIACAPGQFVAAGGAVACQACTPGSYCEASFAVPCPAGTYQPLASATSLAACLNCSAGSSQPGTGAANPAACEACVPGFYAPAPGSRTCAACPAGRFNGQSGAQSLAACLPCDLGTYSSAPGQESCLSDCPPGMVSLAPGAATLEEGCRPCALGSVSAGAGALACAACLPGSYADQLGQTSCTPCPRGSFFNAAGGTALGNCSLCPAGSFNPAPGQTSAGCIPCDPGTASEARGAVEEGACRTCGAGRYAPNPRSRQCLDCPGGTWASPGASFCTPCALGSYLPYLWPNSSSAAACLPCPAGTSTSSTGASSPQQCLALPAACAVGTQPAPPALQLGAPCVPLVCEPPLVPAAGNASGSSACQGCAAGSAGGGGACAPCSAAAPGLFCPGLTSLPLVNFSSAAAAEGAAPGAQWRAQCPTLTDLAAPAPAPPSDLAAALGLPLVLGGAGLCFALALAALYAASQGPSASLSARLLRSVDAYSLLHEVEEGRAPVKRSSLLGGFLTLVAVAVMLLLSLYLVLQWQSSNVLVQQSLAVLSDGTWAAVGSLPWVPLQGGSGSGSSGAQLLVQVTASGEWGACSAPLRWASTGGGAWSLGAAGCSATADGRGPGAPGQPSVQQFTLACHACELSDASALSLLMHHSCQSYLLEVSAREPGTAGAATAVLRVPPRQAQAAPGSALVSMAWTVVPLLSVRLDNTSAGALGASLRGYSLVRSTFAAQQGALLPSASGAGALAMPLAASVALTIALPLQPVYSVTLLTQRVSWTQVLANIVGFGGLLSLFGSVFKVSEKARERLGRACQGCSRAGKPRAVLGSVGGGGGEGEGGGAGERLVTAVNPLHAAVLPLPLPLPLPPPPPPPALPPPALPMPQPPAQQGHQQQVPAGDGGVVWTRHCDQEDVWYSNSAGEVVWTLPQGAVAVAALPATD